VANVTVRGKKFESVCGEVGNEEGSRQNDCGERSSSRTDTKCSDPSAAPTHTLEPLQWRDGSLTRGWQSGERRCRRHRSWAGGGGGRGKDVKAVVC
jgi:hypothetical protein